MVPGYADVCFTGGADTPTVTCLDTLQNTCDCHPVSKSRAGLPHRGASLPHSWYLASRELLEMPLLLYPRFKLAQAPVGKILRHSSQLSELGIVPSGCLPELPWESVNLIPAESFHTLKSPGNSDAPPGLKVPLILQVRN